MPATAKICGLSTPETLDAAIAGGASHVGFVFFPPSPRNLSLDQARALAERVPEHVARVGVFVDPRPALVEEAVRAARLDAVQLHKLGGDQKKIHQFLKMSRTATGGRYELWLAVPVRGAGFDAVTARRMCQEADRIVYDAATPDDALLPGGMGLRFDWSVLHGERGRDDWVLAGGLTPGNVAEAVRVTGATLVDVSSGVETAPGVKDVDKIAAFLKAVRQS
jgi:phosphoribosylanthranilate isomerase